MGCSVQKHKLPISQQTINLSVITQAPTASWDVSERQQNLNTLKSLLRNSNFSTQCPKNSRKRVQNLSKQ